MHGRLAQRCAQLEGQVSTDGVYVEVSDRQQSYVSRSAWAQVPFAANKSLRPVRSAVPFQRSAACSRHSCRGGPDKKQGPHRRFLKPNRRFLTWQAPSSCGEEPLKEDDAFSEYPSVYHPPQVGGPGPGSYLHTMYYYYVCSSMLFCSAFSQEGCRNVRPNEAGVRF